LLDFDNFSDEFLKLKKMAKSVRYSSRSF